MAESFLHGFSSMEKHCSYIQVLISPLCGESRKAAGRSGIPPFFGDLISPEGFLHGFSSMEKHCSYISFSSTCRFAAKSREGASVSGTPSFFWRFNFARRFSPWFQLHGEALLIHFFRRLRRGSLGGNLRGVLFHTGLFVSRREVLYSVYLTYRKVEIS